MVTKGLSLISLVVTLCTCAGPAGAAPLGHWRFDEGTGTAVKDSSGNNLDGTLMGDPKWVAGKIDAGALSFDGSEGLVQVPDSPKLDLDSRLSIAMWVNVADFSTYYFLLCKSPSGSAAANFPGNYEFRIQVTDGALQFGHQTSQGQEYTFYTSSAMVTAGQWHHVAVTFEKGGLVQFYIDGAPAGSAAQSTNFGILNNEPVRIGGRKDGYSFFNGQLDDVYLYDRVLTAEQIEGLYNGIEPVFLNAEMPVPADGTVLEQTFANLQWRPGDFAVSHKVYFGESFEDVAEGRVTPQDVAGNSLQMGFAPPYPAGLVPGQTYFWRVDGINDAKPDSPWKGDVWSFRIRSLTASKPTPRDEVKFVGTNQDLSWEKGLGAIFHIVYFGKSIDAASAPAGGFMTVNPVYDPGLMEPNTTYFWRIDEFAGAQTHKGNIWRFTTVPAIAVGDASLAGWWTFDEVNAGSAVDRSGHGLHGTISGEPGWVEGVAGGAVELDGNDDFFTTPAPVEFSSNTVTMTAWIKPNKVHAMAGLIFHRGGSVCGLNLMASNQLGYHWLVAGSWGFNSGLVVPTNEWSFAALVVEPGKATLYLDGADIWASNAMEHASAVFNSPIILGFDPAVADRHFGGMLDDLRFYTKALTGDEVEQVMNAGTEPSVAVDPMSVESFDSYNAYAVDSGEDVWDVWSDGYGGNGTGSTLGHVVAPFMERVLTVGGHQAAPLYYDNSGAFYDMDNRPVTAKYSEISRSFTPTEDFTRNGATALVFWMRGVSANTAEAADVLYLVLEDGTKTAVVTVAQPQKLRVPSWQKLKVPLADLNIDVAKIRKMTLGIGDSNSAKPGGKGLVYLDNIGLEGQ